MKKMNQERVVVLCHSMGNRTFQYFLQWMKIQEGGQKWIDENIHAFLAVGAPFLGAPKTVRSIVSGDQMGLEVFLTLEESRVLARSSSTLQWLFPLQEDLFPDTIARIGIKRDTGSSSKKKIADTSSVAYEEYSVNDIISLTCPVSKNLHQKTILKYLL